MVMVMVMGKGKVCVRGQERGRKGNYRLGPGGGGFVGRLTTL